MKRTNSKLFIKIIPSCHDCNASSTTFPNIHLSLASLNRELNDAICMDHMFLKKITVLNIMDVATRFSEGAVVNSTSMESVTYHKENLWFSQLGLQILFMLMVLSKTILSNFFIKIRCQNTTYPFTKAWSTYSRTMTPYHPFNFSTPRQWRARLIWFNSRSSCNKYLKWLVWVRHSISIWDGKRV